MSAIMPEVYASMTFKPIKNHESGSKREYLHNLTRRTLGIGNMRAAVQLPFGEEINEWYAANTIDFFNDVSLLWGINNPSELPPLEPGMGFPPGVEYFWAKSNTLIKCSAIQYVDYVMTWVEGQLNDDKIFLPALEYRISHGYSPVVKQIYTRLFRIYAIIYCNYFKRYEEFGAVEHLNTSFKHFVFFSWEYNIIDERELEVLNVILPELRSKYDDEGLSIYGR